MKMGTRWQRPPWPVLLTAACAPASGHMIAQLLIQLGPRAAALIATPTSKIAAHPFPRRRPRKAELHRLLDRRGRVLLLRQLLLLRRRLLRPFEPSCQLRCRFLLPTLGRLYLSFIS